MQNEKKIITLEGIHQYAINLNEGEHADNTVRKYVHDLTALYRWLGGRQLTKIVLIEWKESLVASYAPATVNSMLAAVNSFLKFMGWQEMTVKQLKIQKALFRDESKELNRGEYAKLVNAACREGDEKLSLILQTICATGIRISELQSITAESIRTGRAEVNNKGKRRTIFLPDKLRKLLKIYVKKEKISKGAIFITRNGKPVDRSNIWRSMKKLCEKAEVKPEKVFPHNLRHLFARVYYSMEKDLSKLADILGHTNINTTRIYTMESGNVHARQMERMGLIIT